MCRVLVSYVLSVCERKSKIVGYLPEWCKSTPQFKLSFIDHTYSFETDIHEQLVRIVSWPPIGVAFYATHTSHLIYVSYIYVLISDVVCYFLFFLFNIHNIEYFVHEILLHQYISCIYWYTHFLNSTFYLIYQIHNKKSHILVNYKIKFNHQIY